MIRHFTLPPVPFPAVEWDNTDEAFRDIASMISGEVQGDMLCRDDSVLFRRYKGDANLYPSTAVPSMPTVLPGEFVAFIRESVVLLSANRIAGATEVGAL